MRHPDLQLLFDNPAHTDARAHLAACAACARELAELQRLDDRLRGTLRAEAALPAPVAVLPWCRAALTRRALAAAPAVVILAVLAVLLRPVIFPASSSDPDLLDPNVVLKNAEGAMKGVKTVRLVTNERHMNETERTVVEHITLDARRSEATTAAGERMVTIRNGSGAFTYNYPTLTLRINRADKYAEASDMGLAAFDVVPFVRGFQADARAKGTDFVLHAQLADYKHKGNKRIVLSIDYPKSRGALQPQMHLFILLFPDTYRLAPGSHIDVIVDGRKERREVLDVAYNEPFDAHLFDTPIPPEWKVTEVNEKPAPDEYGP